ncbi:SDR family oxidoreductase [Aliiglaciecola sp. 3_MG-2023]|uniref:SDR family NAD(P)-dependent oxidoreductase n=1 Tax=Aliiglaciecola sp. 3_MG-2023 TaxID=3062644 RepID=UPI0026E3E2F8|nr:SDR family oxidoreductase [Aliiglaciecola sp. 3_MG-2023]MDO6691930.1 SDR family oxidoreductase [Aliiglaciecola sp. 3_MG-2023]
MTIKDKPWALITGANGGIGKALVAEFVENDYRVIATDISHRMDIANDQVVFLQIDLQKFVLDEMYAADFLTQVTEITNGDGISALINNAAIQILGDCQSLSRAQWQNSFDVNLSAPFFMVQTFLNDLSKNAGAVVNVSSIHATQTKKSFVAYATTKAGLSSLTRNLAIDLGNRIRINAIEPAAVGTDMLKAGFDGKEESFKTLELFHPMARIASPQEVAELALFLCSDKASFVHGACISASGGIQGCLSDPS